MTSATATEHESIRTLWQDKLVAVDAAVWAEAARVRAQRVQKNVSLFSPARRDAFARHTALRAAVHDLLSLLRYGADPIVVRP